MKEESNLAKKRDWLNELFNKWSSPVMSQEKKNSLGKEAIQGQKDGIKKKDKRNVTKWREQK